MSADLEAIAATDAVNRRLWRAVACRRGDDSLTGKFNVVRPQAETWTDSKGMKRPLWDHYGAGDFSREQAEDHVTALNIDVAQGDNRALLDEVRELRAVRVRLRGELDAVQSLAIEASDECGGAAETVWALRKERDTAQRALSAAQASNVALREALTTVCRDGTLGDWAHAREQARAALAQPSDDGAVREFGRKVAVAVAVAVHEGEDEDDPLQDIVDAVLKGAT